MRKTGIEIIAEERERQVTKEGWTKDGDLEYIGGELAKAAASYALPFSARKHYQNKGVPLFFPWDKEWWKPSPNGIDGRVKELAKAGSIIAAEIDRLNN